MIHQLHTTESGSSDAIGYILIIGIIAISIASITSVSLIALENAQQIEEDKNITRSMDILESNALDLIEGSVNRRTTQVRVEDNTISTSQNSSSISVNIIGEPESYTSLNDAIVYEGPRTEYRYELGTTTQYNERSESIRLLDDPQIIRYDPDTSTISADLISLQTDSGASVQGGNREIDMILRDSQYSQRSYPTGRQLEITIQSPNIVIWDEYYSSKSYINSCNIQNLNEVTCETVSIQNIQVQQYDIRVRLS